MVKIKIRDVAVVALIAVLICLLVCQAVLVRTISKAIIKISEERTFCDKVNTLRLPIDFLVNEPQCANKLLESMGIENVRLTQENKNDSPKLP